VFLDEFALSRGIGDNTADCPPRPRDPATMQALRPFLFALLSLALGVSPSAGCTRAASAAQADFVPARAREAFETAWQAVNDTHFDKDFNGVDWEAMRAKMLPRVEAAKSMGEVREILSEMLDALGQSHFAVLPAESLPDYGVSSEIPEEDVAGGVGFDGRLRGDVMLVVEVEDGGAAARAGVRTGWILKQLAGQSVADWVPRMSDLRAAKGERHFAYTLRELFRKRGMGPVGSKVEAVFEDADGKEHTFILERTPRDVIAHNFSSTLPTFHLAFEERTFEHAGKRIGYVHFTNWFPPMMQPINEAVESMRGHDGIVIDLRGNGGGVGVMTMSLAGHFFEGRTVFGKQTMRDSTINYISMPRQLDSQGEFIDPYEGPIAILIDETTGSSSEVFAGGLQSLGRARVFGESSMGAVLPARLTRLPNGDAVLHALGDFVTVDGTRLEGRGVVPDVRVPLERAPLLQGRDAALDAALEWLAPTSDD